VTTRDAYPGGVPCWVDSEQPDPESALAFYGGLFGWDFDDRMPADAPGHYFVAKLQGLDVAAISSPQVAATATWNTYICVDGIDDTAARVKDAGGNVQMAPFDVFDQGRTAGFTDPTGAVFYGWEPRKHIGAQLVNAPGSWNFSDLNTRDPAAAKAFYGAVFGWESASFEMGESGFAMFSLPGYGDFLEQREPGLRKRQADEGAPPDFADAVAWLVPMTDEQSSDDVTSHWGVTFAVDDADAIAARATELGGSVLIAPFDAEPVRTTVLRDPQGAVFTASKYEPRA
jgi:uncharacterized protein